MQSRTERFAGLEDAEGDMNEFAHHGADDQHWRLAGGSEATAKLFAPAGAVAGAARLRNLVRTGLSVDALATQEIVICPQVFPLRTPAGRAQAPLQWRQALRSLLRWPALNQSAGPAFCAAQVDRRVKRPSLTYIAQVGGGSTIKNPVNAKLRPGLAEVLEEAPPSAK